MKKLIFFTGRVKSSAPIPNCEVSPTEWNRKRVVREISCIAGGSLCIGRDVLDSYDDVVKK